MKNILSLVLVVTMLPGALAMVHIPSLIPPPEFIPAFQTLQDRHFCSENHRSHL